MLRGWTAGSGLPDESRSGRVILRDYTNGKLVYCVMPPGSAEPYWVPTAESVADGAAAAASQPKWQAHSDDEDDDDEDDGVGEEEDDDDQGEEAALEDVGSWEGEELAAAGSGYGTGSKVRAHTLYSLPKFGPVVSDRPLPASASRAGPSGRAMAAAPGSGRVGGRVLAAAPGGVPLDEADMDMLDEMDRNARAGAAAKRPDYKFNKKAARTKGDRGQLKGEGGFDGGAMLTGKKGGLVRVTGY